MKNESYNGWTNYPTWVVNLWIGNEAHTWFYFRDVILSLKEDDDTSDDDVLYNLSDLVRDFVEEQTPELPGVVSDLLGFALDCVNYDEIAKFMLGKF